MSFAVWFTQDTNACKTVPRLPEEPPADGSDYFILAMQACQALEDAGGSIFAMDGFGQKQRWRDIGYDGSAFVEELPYLIEALREGREYQVDLYPQGIERSLTFTPHADRVRIHCASWTKRWTPVPETEELGRDELLVMLTELAADFSAALKAINCDLVEHEPFRNWLRQ